VPGRNPQEAVRAFLGPLKDALSVLDSVCTLAIKPHKGYRVGPRFRWALNDDDGADLHQAGRFFASMEFEIVYADPKKHEVDRGRYRCSTRGYNYKLQTTDGDRWRFHWHPEGESSEVDPHVHLPPDFKAHRATPRVSLENAIEWCIADGAPLRVSEQEARNKLDLAQAGHVLFRTWHVRREDRPTT
jgi:hypothetical protein